MIYQMKALSELSQKIISEKFSDHFVQSYSWAKLRPSQINILAAREARPKAVRLSNGHPKILPPESYKTHCIRTTPPSHT